MVSGLSSLMVASTFARVMGKQAHSAPSRLSDLMIFGAPIGVSIPMARVAEQNGLQPLVEMTQFQVWRSPDEMRAGVASGRIQITTSPAPTAANLYNRGTGMRLVGVLTTGMLYLMTTDPEIQTLTDLAGKRVLVPFRGDMPDRVLQWLLRSQGMTLRDLQVEYTATPAEAAQLLLAQRAPAAVLQEPAATAAVRQGAANDLSVNRALDLQAEFDMAAGRGADIPMAVLILNDSLRAQAPDLPQALVRAVRAATDWVNANPTEAAQLGESYLDVKQTVLEQSIPYMNLNVRSPQQAKDHLEFFYGELAADSAALLGGQLPDDGFYLDVE